jgi:VWFA-related protein
MVTALPPPAAHRSGQRPVPRASAPRALLAAALLLLCAASMRPSAQQPGGDRPVFRAGTALVTVDVTVRDGSGAVVRGLTAGDFTILEDGRPQAIETFTFQEIAAAPPAGPAPSNLLADVDTRLGQDLQRAASVAPATRATARMPPEAFAGRRLLVLLFDVSSMQPEDVQRAVDSAQQYVDQAMSSSDLVAVATIGSTITVLTDFTADRAVPSV